MIYTLETKARCKCCGRRLNYLTFKHKIIVSDESTKHFLTELGLKYNLRIVEIELEILERKKIPYISVVDMLKSIGQIK